MYWALNLTYLSHFNPANSKCESLAVGKRRVVHAQKFIAPYISIANGVPAIQFSPSAP